MISVKEAVHASVKSLNELYDGKDISDVLLEEVDQRGRKVLEHHAGFQHALGRTNDSDGSTDSYIVRSGGAKALQAFSA